MTDSAEAARKRLADRYAPLGSSTHGTGGRTGPPPAKPAFPLDVLGPWQDWVGTAAGASSAAPDYVAFGLLTSAAALIGNSRVVLPDPERTDWAEPVALWAAIVGPPSSGKTPALIPFEREIDRLEKETRRAYADELADHKTACDIAEQAEKAWLERVKKALKAEEEPPEKPSNAEPPDPVRVPRVVVRDATIEEMARLLNGSPKGLLQLRDELAGWFNSMERYSSASNRPHWLEMYNGKRIVVDRVKHDEPIEVESALVSILGGIQPDKLSEMVDASVDDGLFARFIYCAPEVPRLERATAPADTLRLRAAFARLHQLQLADIDGELKPVKVMFSSEAAELFFSFRKQVRKMAGEASGILAGWIGKADGLVARMAGVLAFLDWAASREACPPETIDAETVLRAIRLWQDYLEPMARHVLQPRGSIVDRAADAILKQARIKRLHIVNARQVRREWGIAGLSRKDVEDAVWAQLEEEGLVRLVKRDGPGRKARDYEVIAPEGDAWTP
ncbi:MAG: DUF3987 domain-containing protein [Pseudomonadota bacterium]